MKTSIKQNTSFRVSFLLIAAIIIALGVIVPPPAGLEPAGWRMIMVVLAVVVLFFSEAMPVIAICLMVVVLMKYLNIVSFKTIQQTACSTTVYFLITGFGIGAAMKKTNLAAILLRFLFRMVKGDSRKLIAAMTIMTAIISIIVSNGVAQVVIITLAVSLFSALGDPEPGTSRLCKGIMLGICVGSQTGGLTLPSSNAVNVVVMDLAESIGGMPMTFLQWCIYGIPVAVILTLFAAWLIPAVTKPEPMTPEQIQSIEKMFDSIPGRLQKNDWYFLIVNLGMIFFWIASNWIDTFDVATVAICGLFALMLPGIGLLTPKEYIKHFQPTVIVLLLCLLPMAAAMSSSGAGEWIINNIFAGADGWSKLVFYIMAAVTAFIVHILIPQASANGALSAMVIGPVAVSCGIPAAAILFIVGCQAGSSYLLPVDGVWGYTLGYGYYAFSDPMRKCWPMVVATSVLAFTVVPLLTMLYSAIGLVA